MDIGLLLIIPVLVTEAVFIYRYYSKKSTAPKPTALICSTIACGLIFGLTFNIFWY